MHTLRLILDFNSPERVLPGCLPDRVNFTAATEARNGDDDNRMDHGHHEKAGTELEADAVRCQALKLCQR